VIPNGRAKSANLIVANGVPYVVDLRLSGVATVRPRWRAPQHAALRIPLRTITQITIWITAT